jgi:hypothetical protein
VQYPMHRKQSFKTSSTYCMNKKYVGGLHFNSDGMAQWNFFLYRRKGWCQEQQPRICRQFEITLSSLRKSSLVIAFRLGWRGRHTRKDELPFLGE